MNDVAYVPSVQPNFVPTGMMFEFNSEPWNNWVGVGINITVNVLPGLTIIIDAGYGPHHFIPNKQEVEIATWIAFGGRAFAAGFTNDGHMTTLY